MKVLSMNTALRIWNAHREIQVGTKLLEKMSKEIADGNDPNPRDVFGRQRKLQMGVPSGHEGQRLLEIEPQLAICVIEGHIANKQRELAEASIAARIELNEPA